MTTMRTIPTVSDLATKPSDVFTFTTGRSLGSPHAPTRLPTAYGAYAGQTRLATTEVRGRLPSMAKHVRIGGG